MVSMFMSDSNKKVNRLINEKSPYLLQHAYNPVDWYPWSEEAFIKAKKFNKPIFLSVGYSTCHWCHVMAHESFEDTQVAKLLNDNFVCIKVDREERPDIDKIFMDVCQLLTGSGGWPLTIIMTPDKEPFFAATYLPKETRYGIKGLMTLIPEVKRLWEHKTDSLLKSARKITETLKEIPKQNTGKELDQKTLVSAYEQLFNSFDELHGGFGYQPKFPMPHNLLFLLRYWKKTKNNYCLKMVETTLEQLRQGGIYDHIGFGFHRYSTDRNWILPHFEKMLYDQALLIITYSEAYQATKKEIFKKTAREIIEYVIRDMTSSKGGFYSAEDADSEEEEGKFYTWSYEEISKELTSEEMELASKFFNIKKEGNFNFGLDEKSKENIFYQTMDTADFAKFYKIEEKILLDKLEKIRKQLFLIREKRIHPEKDDKILTDWNGLMIAALSIAASVFNEKKYVKYVEKALNFIIKNMSKKSGELLHTYRKGEAKISGYADDYAFLIWGLIELYQATLNSIYLKISLDLNKYLMNHFWDKTNGGLFFISDTEEKLFTRKKEVYDGAIPSANSVQMYNLTRLARITGNPKFEEKALQITKIFSDQISKIPSGHTQMMVGLNFAIGPSFEIIIVGNKDKKDTQKIIRKINSMYVPNKVTVLKQPDSKETLIEGLAPFIKKYSQVEGKSTIYVCKNQQCQVPTTKIDDIKKLLEN
jgi:hypothetical protein